MSLPLSNVTVAVSYFKGLKMIFRLEIETDEEDFNRCICAAWLNCFPDDKIEPDQIKPFALYDEVSASDVENMLLGSSLGELASQSKNIIMKRVE